MKAHWLGLLLLPLLAQADELHWDFEVRLDGKPIGSHRFTLSQQGDDRVLSSSADFTVKFLGIVAYRYYHQDLERWHGECLVNMDASTMDDGKPTQVLVRSEADGLHIAVNDAAAAPQTGCLMSFAYWNPALRTLAPSRLLNAQNGRIENVKVMRLPDGQIEVHGVPQPTQHWRITGVEAPIELWYSAQGDWLAMDSQVRGGRVLQYRLR